jgi:hypothetical protein
LVPLLSAPRATQQAVGARLALACRMKARAAKLGARAMVALALWVNHASAQPRRPQRSDTAGAVPASAGAERVDAEEDAAERSTGDTVGEGGAGASADEPPPPRADKARNYEREPGTEPEDVALAAPRAVLAVPRYALKIVFFPIQQTVAFVDRHALVEEVVDVLYNDERTGAILPRLSFDSFFGPSFGVQAFHEDLGGNGEYGSASAQFGGIYNWASQLSFRADRFGGSRLWLESSARVESEPALLFQGIGNHDAEAKGGAALDARAAGVATRFAQERYLTMLRAGYTFGAPGMQVQLGATALYNVRDFAAKQKGSEPSIEQVYATSSIVGFDERVSVLEADVNLIVDTRNVKGATSSGLYFEAFAGRVPHFGEYGFWHHGAEASLYLDLYRATRVLVLRAVVEGVEGPAGQIPFSELPRLGGPHRLRGYPLDRFRDEKAAVGTLEYHYPIHQIVAGSLYVDAGRVANDYGDFLKSNWKVGGGGGFIVRSRDRQLFTFDVAYGEGVQFLLTTDPLRAFTNRDTEL